MPSRRSQSELRCSDAERERVVAFLRDQHYAGRITNDELDERVGLAYQAVHVADLERLIDDLPRAQRHPAPARSRRARPQHPGLLVPLGIAGLILCGGPVILGLAIGLAAVVLATVFAASVVLAPLLVVVALLVAALKRRRPAQHWRPHY